MIYKDYESFARATGRWPPTEAELRALHLGDDGPVWWDEAPRPSITLADWADRMGSGLPPIRRTATEAMADAAVFGTGIHWADRYSYGGRQEGKTYAGKMQDYLNQLRAAGLRSESKDRAAKVIAEAYDLMKPPLFVGLDPALKLDMSPGAIFYADGNGHVREFPGLASRYWPQSGDHQHMNDLTLSPAPKGGFTVLNYDDDVLFAGTAADCCNFMQSHFETLATEKAQQLAAKAAQEAQEAEVARIRQEAEDRIKDVRSETPATQPLFGRRR